METITINNQDTIITASQLLRHWQGHRSLTRRVIEAFPEDQLFNFSVADMRSFAHLAQELLDIAERGIQGVVTRQWPVLGNGHQLTFNTRAELLQRWDEVTMLIEDLWPQIPEGRLQERDLAFGLYEGQVYETFFYFIDNEIHHRGQAYVFLRALGIQPPFFWER